MTNQDIPDYPAALRPREARAGFAGQFQDDDRLDRLLHRLPDRWRKAVRRLRQPSARWVRIPAGVLLIIGSGFSILPVLGLWMMPLGLVLLAEDIPALHRLRARTLDWLERRRPHWFAGGEATAKSQEPESQWRDDVKSFEDRGKAFEDEFKRSQDLAFRVAARRNRLFGSWAAEKLGMTGAAAEGYARSIVDADFQKPGDGDVIEKVRSDLVAKGIDLSEARLRAELDRAAAEARRQLAEK